MVYDDENSIYYVYIYLDPRKPGSFIYGEYEFDYEPFYVGKGKNDRISSHLACRESYNSYKNNKIKKIISLNLEPIILKIKDCLAESESLDFEVYLIAQIGRLKVKTGPLLNLTPGGIGGVNDMCKTPEFCEKMKEHWANWKKNNPDKVLENIEKAKITKKQNFALGLTEGSFKGKTHSLVTKQRIGAANSKKQKEKNSQFGTCWIHHCELKKNKKISKNDFEIWNKQGWVLGRKMIFDQGFDQTKHLNAVLNTIWISNLELKKTKHIKKEKLDIFLSSGWVIGRKIF